MSSVVPATSIRLECASIMSASPRISSTVSPLARKAIRKPATCAGLASPLMIWSIAHPDSMAPRSCPESSDVKIVGQVIALPADVPAVIG